MKGEFQSVLLHSVESCMLGGYLLCKPGKNEAAAKETTFMVWHVFAQVFQNGSKAEKNECRGILIN